MHESGQKTIIDAKQNGLWNFMDDVVNLIIPDDLKNELQKIRMHLHSLNLSMILANVLY